MFTSIINEAMKAEAHNFLLRLNIFAPSRGPTGIKLKKANHELIKENMYSSFTLRTRARTKEVEANNKLIAMPAEFISSWAL
jgi:hypothetical protein